MICPLWLLSYSFFDNVLSLSINFRCFILYIVILARWRPHIVSLDLFIMLFDVARAALCANDAQEQIAILDRFEAVHQIGQCGVHSDGAQMRIPHVVA